MPPNTVSTEGEPLGQWRQDIVGGRNGTGAAAVGTPRCVTVRRIGCAARASTSDGVPADPPRARGVGGIDGPTRALVDVAVTPLAATSFGVSAAFVYPSAGPVTFVRDRDLAEGRAGPRVDRRGGLWHYGTRLTGWARGGVAANDLGHDEAPHIRGKVRGFALRWPLAASGRVGSGAAKVCHCSR